MKATELIKLIQNTIAIQGDVEVEYVDFDFSIQENVVHPILDVGATKEFVKDNQFLNKITLIGRVDAV